MKERNNTHTILPAWALLALACVLMPQTAGAFFSGSAAGAANTFQASNLAITASPTTTNANFAATGTSTVNVTVSDAGSLPPAVSVAAAAVACDAAWFNAIEAVATETSERFSGPLGALAATSSATGTWQFDLTANGGLVAENGETCSFELIFTGYQARFTSAGQGGFDDTARVTITLTATEDIGPQPTTNVVLNEIYPNETATGTPPNDDEWIELYNGTGGAVDVAGYAVSEETSGGSENVYEVVASCPASGGGDKIAPFSSSNTVIPDGGLLVLAFCGGGDYLNNTAGPSTSVADTVRLYNGTPTSTATMLDMHGYPDTPDGKSHARIPDGSEWVDPVPTPGTPNTATADELRAEGWSEEKIAAVLPHLPPAGERERAFRFASTTDDMAAAQENAHDTGGAREATSTTPAATSTSSGAATGTPAQSPAATTTDETATSTPHGTDTATSTDAGADTATTTAATSTDDASAPREDQRASTTAAALTQTGTSTPETDTDSPPLQETARESREAQEDTENEEDESQDTPPEPTEAPEDEAHKTETENDGDEEGATDAAPATKQDDESEGAASPESE